MVSGWRMLASPIEIDSQIKTCLILLDLSFEITLIIGIQESVKFRKSQLDFFVDSVESRFCLVSINSINPLSNSRSLIRLSESLQSRSKYIQPFLSHPEEPR